MSSGKKSEKSRKLVFEVGTDMNELQRSRNVNFTGVNQASSTPIKNFDVIDSPCSSTSSPENLMSYEKILELPDLSCNFKSLLHNMEDMAEEMYELKQELFEQNLQIGKQLSKIDNKLSGVNRNNETKETGGELCESFEYKDFQNGDVNRSKPKLISTSSDSDEDYPDVMNISHNFSSLMSNLENIIGMEPEGLLDEVESIESKLRRLEIFMAEQKSVISRLELTREALLAQNEKMLKNQKRLEEEQEVKVKIIQSKDQEIKNLKDLVNKEGEVEKKKETFEICEISPVIQNLGLFLSSPRETLSKNMSMLKEYLAGEPEKNGEEDISWGDIAITTSAKILGCVLSKIF